MRASPKLSGLLLVLAVAGAAGTLHAQQPPRPADDAPAGGTAKAAAQPAATPPAQDAAKPAEAPTEKSLLAAFHAAWSPSDAAARAGAIATLGDATRLLPDGGSSKLVARALGKGLLDDELEVRAAAVSQLDWGRHVDSVIELFDKCLPDLLSQIDRRLTRPDEESTSYVQRGSRLLGDACAALANYRDDRSVETLVTLLRSLDRNTTGGNNLSSRVISGVASAVLVLGTHDAVEAAVRQTQTYVGAGGWQQAPARLLHTALAEYAVTFGQAPPEFSENVSVDWNAWWGKVKDKLPAKLGRLKTPPTSPPPRAMPGDRARKDDGRAPRP